MNKMCDIITQDGCTALFLALSKGHVGVVRLLIERKADVNICNKVCLFHSSCRYCLYYCFCLQGELTPIYAASYIGQRYIVDLLIKAGADIHLASLNVGQIQHLQSLDTYILLTFKSGDVPLGIAARMGDAHTVERLLQAKANINYQNKVIIYKMYNHCCYHPELVYRMVALLSTWPHQRVTLQ